MRELADKSLEYLRNEMTIDPNKLIPQITSFIKKHMQKMERDGVILGLSGGLDSAVVAELCIRAVGAQKTLALLMPEKDSSKVHLQDAIDLAKQFKLQSKMLDITPYLNKIGIYRTFPFDTLIPKGLRESLVKKVFTWFNNKTGTSYFSRTLHGSDSGMKGEIINRSFAYYRAKHRLRMLLLYLFGERDNRLVVGAANKSEYMVGFFVKYGIDASTDIMPIMGLYKTQVIELARHLGIPTHIINKQPSPDLIPGLVDENAIGLPYSKMDLILLAIEKGWSDEEMTQVLSKADITFNNILYVRDLMKQSEHMRTVYIPD